MLARPENRSKVERLTAEIDAFGRTKVPTFEDLDRFPWLEVCRISPIVLAAAHPGAAKTFLQGSAAQLHVRVAIALEVLSRE